MQTAQPAADENAERKPELFLVGAQWRIGRHISTALVLADLSKSPRLAAAAQIVPEVGLATMASAMVRRPAAVERVLNAVDAAARKKIVQSQAAEPGQWPGFDAEKIEKSLAEMREKEKESWPKAWLDEDDAREPLSDAADAVSLWHLVAQAVVFPLGLRTSAHPPALNDVLAETANAAAQEIKALFVELLGPEALLFARAVSPQENEKNNGIDTGALALAELERSALLRAAGQAEARGEAAEAAHGDLARKKPRAL
jgi:hypothetical protein